MAIVHASRHIVSRKLACILGHCRFKCTKNKKAALAWDMGATIPKANAAIPRLVGNPIRMVLKADCLRKFHIALANDGKLDFLLRICLGRALASKAKCARAL